MNVDGGNKDWTSYFSRHSTISGQCFLKTIDKDESLEWMQTKSIFGSSVHRLQ